MRTSLRFLVFLLTIAGVFAIFKLISTNGHGQGLNITAEDYAVGSKRFAAISTKVTPALKADFKRKGLQWGSPIFMRAFKEERLLELWVKNGRKFELFRIYHIAGASGELGPKEREGDRQVPEGFYYVTPSQMNPQSDFHLSFNIGYPNRFDKAHDRTGSFIMIHGSDVSIGCLAMTNEKIEEIYTLADAAFHEGQKFFRVHLFPFRMTSANMDRHSGNRWAPFWKSLRPGFLWFEDKKEPPNVSVRGKSYHFN